MLFIKPEEIGVVVEPYLIAGRFNGPPPLCQQIELLELQKKHLEDLISHARTIQKTGVMHMDFNAYDSKKLDAYAQEAKKRWGHTDAWKQSQGKTPNASQMEEIFQGFAALLGTDPADAAVQAKFDEKKNIADVSYAGIIYASICTTDYIYPPMDSAKPVCRILCRL